MKIRDKAFEKFIKAEDISKRIKAMSSEICADYKDKEPLFIAILNGSFMFAADLMKEVDISAKISFVKVASYTEMESSGNVKQLIGLNEPIFKKDVVVIEDIVDTGKTMKQIVDEFNSLGASSVEIISLLRKPESLVEEIEVKYVGFDIPNKFVVGYGLDYDGLGRNLKDIYQLKG